MITRLVSQDAQATTATTAVTATYPGATTAGDLLIASVYGNSNTVPTIVGWTGFTEKVDANTASVSIFYKLADGTETAILASALSTSLMKLNIYEYTGNADPIVLDVALVGNGNSSSASPSFSLTSITTTLANDLIFGSIVTKVAVTSPSFTSGLDTRQINTTGNIRLFDGDSIPGTIVSSLVSTGSWTTSTQASGVIGAFEAASSGPPPSDKGSTLLMMGMG